MLALAWSYHLTRLPPPPAPQPFLVFGLLTTGLAVGAHNSGAGAAKAAELLDAASALMHL